MNRDASLKLALEIEEEGYQYYSEQAKKVQNPLSKTLLQTLAQQELQHKDMIEKLHQGTLPESNLSEDFVEETVRNVFTSFSEQEREGWTEDNLDVYEHAMDLEKSAFELYQDLAQKADSESERKFFEALMKQEEKHLESLINVHYYLSSPENWLHGNEADQWNWMV